MGPYDSSTSSSAISSSPSSSTSSSSSSSSCAGKSPDQIDGLLAGAGYRVRSSELRHVAQRLEHLETVMVNAPSQISHLGNDVVHHNPSDLGTWVDSLLSDLNPPEYSDLRYDDFGPILDPSTITRAWTEHLIPEQQRIIPQHLSVATEMEEDSSIRLVHVLMTCAECVQGGEFSLACSLIDEMQHLLTRVNVGCGIGKVAGYFVDALSRRLFTPQGVALVGSTIENEILYNHFYEASPYLKFAHFTANQAILEGFDGHDCVHVIDFNLMHGLQWPALIQALALRPGGPPVLRLTGIGPPSPDGRDSLREIGVRLTELARSVNVRFAFQGVTASRLEDVKPLMLQVDPKEAVAINSIMQLHRLLVSDPTRTSPINNVLDWIRNLNPKIMTVVEQEVDHNQPEFLARFTEALYYYSTMFDSLETCSAQFEKAFAEMYIQKEICNVVCCEGSVRVERHEPLAKWRARLNGAGFKPLHLGSNSFKQASMLLTLFSAEGYCVEENDGCLTLGWHSRPLIAASAWKAVSEPNPSLGLISHPNNVL
ncbi:DELLA protein like [Actinidia chinensis var. chinensis]|uniref:DELLA protein n=1 Tax=Actinidia chinensis var. chinensis TaxID=1590841 RepID=A0A2R6S1V7_ACTCC|nr:DELLA protein like [Actinidia chinensis var. chinensis]